MYFQVPRKIDYLFYLTLGWKRYRLFVYSAGKAIVLGNAPTTQITTKWAAEPVVIFVLLKYFLTLLPYQLSRQTVYSFFPSSVKEIIHAPTNPK